MMKRSDERKEVGAGVARSPAAARRAEDPIASERVSREAHDPMRDPDEEIEDSSMARTPAAAKRGAMAHERGERADQEGEHSTVRSGRGIGLKSVEADFVMGEGGKTKVATAEGESDMASGKANRKEAMEPEREMSETKAMGGDRTVAHKNAMSHGERETIARNTI